MDPDIIVMSEVNHNYVTLWRETMGSLGYSFFADPDASSSRLGAAIATRLPAKQLTGLFDHGQYAGAIVSAEIASTRGDFDLHSVYARPDSGRTPTTWMKPAILDSIPRNVVGRPLPQIVAGDFNAPQAETAAGDWISFAHEFSKARDQLYRPVRKTHMDLHDFKDAAESAMSRPREDMRCAFRVAGLPDSPRTSWRHSSGSEKYRLDHIIASEAVMPTRVWYTDDFPAGGDHRAMIAEW
jgi:exonuclease III